MAAPIDYELDDSPARIDMRVVWGFLSTEAYWARWRTRDIVEQQAPRQDTCYLERRLHPR